MTGITLLGLGPGDPNKLTREAWEMLVSTKDLWVRTAQHPTLAGLPASINIHSFDSLYENGDSFEQVYDAIVEKILELGKTVRWRCICRSGASLHRRSDLSRNRPPGTETGCPAKNCRWIVLCRTGICSPGA